jgi:predicted nicotinamide N-methyase
MSSLLDASSDSTATSTIYRVSSYRNICHTIYVNGTTSIQMIICTEDRLEIYKNKDIGLSIECYYLDTHVNVPIDVRCKYREGVYDISIKLLIDTHSIDSHALVDNNHLIGPLQLLIRPQSTTSHPIIFPFLSDLFFASSVPLKRSLPPLLSCYRQFDLSKTTNITSSSSTIAHGDNNIAFKVKESFGSALGSHIWDSAYMLWTYFINTTTMSSRTTVLELGCGSGAVGLACAAYFKEASIILTDLPSQRQLVEENILLNGLTNCVFSALDWCSLAASEVNLGERRVDYILAADVLYNAEVLPFLFDVLRKYSTAGHTVVYISQKRRSDSSNLHIESAGDLIWERVSEQYHVVIWRISLR